MRALFDGFRFRLACLIAGDLIDKLAICAAMRAGERRWLAGYKLGTQDARLLAAIRSDLGEMRLLDGEDAA